MNIKDLMIGDWVMFLAEKPFPVKIVAIDSTSNCARHSKSDCYYTLDCFEPILLKMNFIKKNFPNRAQSCYNVGDRTLRVRFFEDDAHVSLRLRYVHELQHALNILKINTFIQL